MAWLLYFCITLLAVGLVVGRTADIKTGESCWLPGPNITISEGDAQMLQIAVSCSEQINPSDCTFNLSCYPITATPDEDYFTFATLDGDKPAIDVNISDNTVVEDNERFAVELNSVSCQGIPDVNVTIPITIVTIVDDDVVMCSLPASLFSAWELLDPSENRIAITVQCDNEVEDDGFMLEIAYINRTAVAPFDYIQTPTMVSIPTATTSFTFDVPIVADGLPELPELFQVRLSDVHVPSAFTRTTAARYVEFTAPIIIYDGTLNCSLDVANATVIEGTNSSAEIRVECNLEVSNDGWFLLIEYLDVTAVASSDYLDIQTRIPIPTSTRTFSIGVPIVNDDDLEEAETFTVRCSGIAIQSVVQGAVSYGISETVTTIVIFDDDGEVIDPCETNDCSNGATCVPAGQSFNCSCPPGFEGPICGDALSNDDLQNRLMQLTELLEGNTSTEDIQGAAELVENASGQDGFLEENPANVDIVVDSLELITGAGDAMVTKPVVQIVNNLMDLDPDVLVDSTSGGGRVIAALEEQISNVQALQGNFSASLENLEIAAVQIDRNNIASSLFFANLTPLNSTPSDNSSSATEANTRLYADGDDVPVNRTDVAITIPADVIDLFTREDEDPTALPVSFFIYANSVLFTPSRTTFNRSNEEDQSNATFEERIISKVIGGAISKREESSQELSLNSAVITKFITNKALAEDEMEDEMIQQCVHWSYDDKTKEGYWSMEGCTGSPDGQGRIVCSCKRLASFAVLVRVRKGSLKDRVALYFITLIGSIISSICLCMCLITFVAVRSYRTKQPTQIHFNLCLSLLGFYLAFLLSPLGTGNVIRCSVASAFIHFFGLATMAWMTAEAVNMYFLFVQLRRTAIPHFVPVSCLLAYGLPAICAVVVAVLDRNSNFRNADYCFIHPGPALYFGFLTEVAVMLVTNLVIFALISRKTLCRPLMASKARENAQRDEIIKRVRHSVLFWFILGLSWIFGALAILDGSTVIFDYLYSICISLQGLVMFLLLCVANPEFRKVFADRMQRVNTTITRNTSTGASTSTSTGNTSFIKPATISGSEEGLQ